MTAASDRLLYSRCTARWLDKDVNCCMHEIVICPGSSDKRPIQLLEEDDTEDGAEVKWSLFDSLY